MSCLTSATALRKTNKKEGKIHSFVSPFACILSYHLITGHRSKMAGELNFKGSPQSLGKSEDFILTLTSSQGVVKLKKVICSYYEAAFATGKKCYGLKIDI